VIKQPTVEIKQSSVEQFLDDLAGGAPTPGGGSAAAMIGAMGASLISMVCNVTLGKKGLEALAPEMLRVRGESEALRARLTDLIEHDIAAFSALMAAYRLPKGTDEEKSRRATAIQSSLRLATETPLECARACAQIIALSRRAAESGYSGVISDAGVGVLAAHAALRSAALNVTINAPSLEDRRFAEQATVELQALLDAGARESESVFGLVQSRLQ
jgi:formiminotetrahydrofolate cyclodeaminase